MHGFDDTAAAFREADAAMGEAFRRKLGASAAAERLWLDEKRTQVGFATAAGVSYQYASRVRRVSKDPKLVLQPQLISGDTLKKLLSAPEGVKDEAIARAEAGVSYDYAKQVRRVFLYG